MGRPGFAADSPTPSRSASAACRGSPPGTSCTISRCCANATVSLEGSAPRSPGPWPAQRSSGKRQPRQPRRETLKASPALDEGAVLDFEREAVQLREAEVCFESGPAPQLDLGDRQSRVVVARECSGDELTAHEEPAR